MWRYRNPVDVKFGAGVFDTVGKALAGRAYCLVTYDDANGGGVFADLHAPRRRHGRCPGRHGAQHRPQSGLFIGLAQSCRTYAAATRPVESDRGAGRRLGDGCRQGPGRRGRRLQQGAAPSPDRRRRRGARPHA